MQIDRISQPETQTRITKEKKNETGIRFLQIHHIASLPTNDVGVGELYDLSALVGLFNIEFTRDKRSQCLQQRLEASTEKATSSDDAVLHFYRERSWLVLDTIKKKKTIIMFLLCH